jgi:hypothetical protein
MSALHTVTVHVDPPDETGWQNAETCSQGRASTRLIQTNGVPR